MPQVQGGYNPGAEALRTTAAPNLQAVQERFDPRQSKAFQLAEALGKAQPQIDKFSEDMAAEKRRKEILDTMQIPAFQLKAKQELGDGVIDAVQAKRLFPGVSETIIARTNDGLGAIWGRENVQGLIDGVNADANLIQDPAKRAAYIKEKKNELIAKLPKDNPYYISGALDAINKEVGSFENKWQSQSAAYQIEVQTKDFSGKVVEAITSDNPEEALTKLDETWKVSSALDNNTRNALVVKSITQQAYATNDVNLLKKIPTRFLNSETRAQIATTNTKIVEKKMSDYRFVKTMETDKREEDIRSGKNNILSRFTKGEAVDPAEFQNSPELFNFAISVKDSPRLPSSLSAGNSQKVRTAILNQATLSGMDENKLIAEIQTNKALNPNDREKLINELPKLIEGNLAMNDDMVKSSLNLRLEARMKALESSPNSLVQKMVTGTNLRSQVMRNFDVNIRNGFQSYYEDNQKWPTGRAKQDIVDRETDRAEALLEKLTDPKNIGKPEGSPSATARTPAPTAAPVRIKDAAEYSKLPSGATYITPDGVTKRKP